jgi:hypothetical protein
LYNIAVEASAIKDERTRRARSVKLYISAIA